MPPYSGIRFHPMGPIHVYDLAPCPEIRIGEFVVAVTDVGRKVGQVMWKRERVDPDTKVVGHIEGPASPRELVLAQVRRREAQALLERIRSLACKHGLRGVSLVYAELDLDGTSLVLGYAVEDQGVPPSQWQAFIQQAGKVFRGSLLWQRLGPRDVAKWEGGWGPCGRVRCCAQFLTDFQSIQIRMAKAQNVSLSGPDITGACGRLRCCLAYEYPVYQEMLARLPKPKNWVMTPRGRGRVVEVQPLQMLVRVEFPDGARLLFAHDQVFPLPCEGCPAVKGEDEEDEEKLPA